MPEVRRQASSADDPWEVLAAEVAALRQRVATLERELAARIASHGHRHADGGPDEIEE